MVFCIYASVFHAFPFFFCKVSLVLPVDDQCEKTLESSKIRFSYLMKDRTWNYRADEESKLTAYERFPVGVHRNDFGRTNRSTSERSNSIPTQLQRGSSAIPVA